MNFLEKIHRKKQNAWEVEFKNPCAMYESACESISKYFYICGAERFKSEYSRMNARLAFLVVDLVLYLVLSVWCISELWGDMVDVIFCIVTTGVAFQGFMKIICYTSVSIYDLHQTNVQFYSKTSKFPEVRNSLLNTATHCKIAIRSLEMCYPYLASLILILPVIISLIYRSYELPFGFFFPVIDRNTLIGYLINYAYHALQLFEAVAGLLATDMCFFVLIMSGVGQLDVLIIYLQKVGEITMNCDESQKKDEQFQLLVEIVEKHIEHIAYISKLETLTKNYFFGNFGCLIFETVTSLYVIATVDDIWYPGFIIVFGGIFQIGIPCVLGTLLSNKNDQLICEIYNTPWNMLSVSEQKLMQVLLHSAQNPTVLSDGFCPINLFNFVSIYKKIYSYLTMLLSIN